MNGGNVYTMRKKRTDHTLFTDSHHYTATLCRYDFPVNNGRYVLTSEAGLMLTVGQERSPHVNIDTGSGTRAVTFTTNCEYIVSGDDEGIQVWRVKDGKRIAKKEVENVTCLAVSKDGRWIAAGTWRGHVSVWDAETYEQAFTLDKDVFGINGADFSPDSTRLVTASSNSTATIWDVTLRKHVQTLRHVNLVTAAKYSPQGDRIATVTEDSIRVWNSDSGRLLVDIPVTVTPLYDTSLLWFNNLNHLFVISASKIKRFDASTGLVVSQWPAPDTKRISCIALPRHGKFIAYSTNRTVTFWDTSTYTQLALIQHSQDILSIALSPDDRFIAIGGIRGKITIESLSRVTVSTEIRSVTYVVLV